MEPKTTEEMAKTLEAMQAELAELRQANEALKPKPPAAKRGSSDDVKLITAKSELAVGRTVVVDTARGERVAIVTGMRRVAGEKLHELRVLAYVAQDGQRDLVVER
jgi:hypothetical protein